MSEKTFRYILRYKIDPLFHPADRIDELLRFCNESRTEEVMLFFTAEELTTGHPTLAEGGALSRTCATQRPRHRKLSVREQSGNRSRFRTRSRVEHIFGVQTMMIGDMVIRAIGKTRVQAMIGMLNLVYNLNRYRLLALAG